LSGLAFTGWPDNQHAIFDWSIFDWADPFDWAAPIAGYATVLTRFQYDEFYVEEEALSGIRLHVFELAVG
jgi:hypothetical protein